MGMRLLETVCREKQLDKWITILSDQIRSIKRMARHINQISWDVKSIDFGGISRDSRHKRNATGAKRAQYRKKRKFELGRQAANTKLGAKRIHEVRTRGGNKKFRAMRLDSGNFSWGSEAISRKARIVAVVYNASNNELVRTGTLVKNAIVQVDATPFRQWYESHYAVPIGARKGKGAAK
ncbi:hypothetical protein BGZ79_006357, partial [Entomortierella chlamydospora]